MTKSKGKVELLVIAFLLIVVVQLLEAWLLMVAVGAVWSETGWLHPISFAGSLASVWLIYVVKAIWGTTEVYNKSDSS